MSISLSPEPLKLLRRRARQAHHGNLSAAIAEAAEFLRRDLAMVLRRFTLDDLELVIELEKEHGPLTDEDRAMVGAELRAQVGHLRRKKKRAA